MFLEYSRMLHNPLGKRRSIVLPLVLYNLGLTFKSTHFPPTPLLLFSPDKEGIGADIKPLTGILHCNRVIGKQITNEIQYFYIYNIHVRQRHIVFSSTINKSVFMTENWVLLCSQELFWFEVFFWYYI